MNKKSVLNYLLYFVYGIFVGGCILVPGMSSGTLLIVLGLYGLLITHLTGFYKSKKQFLNALLFFGTLGAGVLIGIFSFSKALTYLIENFSLPTFALFAGFVTGVIPFIISTTYKSNIVPKQIKATEQKNETRKFKWWHLIPLIITMALVITFALLQPSETGVKELTPSTGIMLFVVGAIAAAEMLIPGISGSFLLVLLGYYTTILNAVTEFKILVLLIFVAGIPFGLFVSALAMKYLINKFRTTSYLAIAGLLIGSVIAIFVIPDTYDTGTNAIGIVSAVFLYIVGFFCTYFLTRIEKKRNKDILAC